MSGAPGSERISAFKNYGKTTQDMRSRRLEVTVELRKSKKEDQMFKRRNINADDYVSPVKQIQSPGVEMTIDEIVEAMSSSDPQENFKGTQAARKMLSREVNPPIELLVGRGIVPLCVKFLGYNDNTSLQFEAAWALTNIASGTSEQTHTVIEAGAIPYFAALLHSPAVIVAEQSVWGLGNIAGDGASPRDIVLSFNVVEGIVNLINSDISTSFLRNIVWLISNLCRNKNPTPSFEKIAPLLPCLCNLLDSSDNQILADACWAFAYVTDDENSKIQAVIDTGAVPKLIKLLDMDDPSVLVPALRTVGNIVTGTDVQTDTVIAAGGLSKLEKLLQHSKNNIVKEAAWTVSNITAGNQAQLQAVLETGIFYRIRDVLEHGDFKSQKEAAWAVINSTTCGTDEQTISLVDKFGILKPFLDLLDSKDPRTVKVILNGLSNLLSLAEKLNSGENFCLMVEELGGLDKLEALQNHENEEIYKTALTIIDTYFGTENSESELAPKEVAGTMEFNSSAADPPSCGFKF